MMDAEELHNRFEFHPADSEAKKMLHNRTRNKCNDLADWLNYNLPEGREKSLAVTHLEEVMHWANAAIARKHEAS